MVLSKKRGSFGYSLALRYKVDVEGNIRMKTTKRLVFAPVDLGRRAWKSGEKQVKEYLDKKTDKINFSKSRYITALGISAIFLGILSIAMSALFGVWQEVNPRQMKKKA